MAEIIPLPTKQRESEPRTLDPRTLDPRALEPRALEPLWREVLGERLRRLRRERGERLADTSARAGLSPQYLSEVERGLKEPSSEMIAAIAGALGIGLIDLTAGVVDDLRARTEQRPAVGSVSFRLAA